MSEIKLTNKELKVRHIYQFTVAKVCMQYSFATTITTKSAAALSARKFRQSTCCVLKSKGVGKCMLRVPQEVLLLTLHRASLAKYMLLEIVKEVIYKLQVF